MKQKLVVGAPLTPAMQANESKDDELPQPSQMVDTEDPNEMSDEYSDDDDPGYRIVLVEEVGELFPDISYRLRRRAQNPEAAAQSTRSAPAAASKPDVPAQVADVKATPEDGEEEEEGEEADDEEDEEADAELEDDDTQDMDTGDANVGNNESAKATGAMLLAAAAASEQAIADDGETTEGKTIAESDANADLAADGVKAGNKASKDAEKEKGEGGGEEVEEDGVGEEALAAHHMPDLIQGLQPMFVSDPFSPPTTQEGGAPAAHGTEQPDQHAAASQGGGDAVGTADGATAAGTGHGVVAGGKDATAKAAGGDASTTKPLGRGAKGAEDAVEGNDDTVYYDCFDLKIVYERNRTGFEETKDYPIEINGVIAGRYQILEFLGAAAFSKAVQCVDLTDGSYVCIKIIKNNKDFFDQSLDEIKILKYINAHDARDDHHLLQLYDYFYFKEHLFIVTELLRDNLYEFSKFNRESGAESYFTMPRLQKIARECLVGLKFVHALGLIHCDLKPENVLIRSYSRCEIKIIDFGSSCFVTDHLTSYVQSRSYRAPEVILGLPYDQHIDMWSLGCILAELWTGRVLFQNDSLATLLARVVGILGAIDDALLLEGRYTHRFFTKHKILYDRMADEDRSLVYIFPKRTTLQHRLGTEDALFVDFLAKMLAVDPAKRSSAAQALQHPWLAKAYV